MARDFILENTNFEILGGYFSPVSDFYQKQGLAEAKHRVRMCELAVERSSAWLMVDDWESLQTSYQRTAIVLDHFQQELNGLEGEGGIRLQNGMGIQHSIIPRKHNWRTSVGKPYFFFKSANLTAGHHD